MNEKEIKYVDYHAHLSTFKDRELDEIFENAKNENVLVVVCGTGKYDNKRTIEIARKYNVNACIGIDHANMESDVVEFEQLLKDNLDIVVGIGEVGIDLHWRKDNLKEQLVMFDKMVEISMKYSLPLVIHCREAAKELFEHIQKYKGKIKGILHSYQDDYILAQKFIAQFDFYIGITGVVTYKNDIDVKNLVKYIPLNRLITETDSPYLNPQKYRIYKPVKLKNQPAYVTETLLEISKIAKISVDKAKKQVFENYKKLFNR